MVSVGDHTIGLFFNDHVGSEIDKTTSTFIRTPLTSKHQMRTSDLTYNLQDQQKTGCDYVLRFESGDHTTDRIQIQELT